MVWIDCFRELVCFSSSYYYLTTLSTGTRCTPYDPWNGEACWHRMSSSIRTIRDEDTTARPTARSPRWLSVPPPSSFRIIIIALLCCEEGSRKREQNLEPSNETTPTNRLCCNGEDRQNKKAKESESCGEIGLLLLSV